MEFELVKALQTSRSVLRGALQQLVDESVVTRVRGSGTYAIAHRHHIELTRLSGFRESQPRGKERATYRVLEAKEEVATFPVAAALHLEPGDPVMLLERIALLDDEPVAVLTHWLPASLAGGLFALDLSVGYYELLEQGLGLELGSARSTADAVSADSGTARLLGVAVGAPLLFLQTVTSLAEGRPIDVVFSRTRPDRMVFISTMRRSSS